MLFSLFRWWEVARAKQKTFTISALAVRQRILRNLIQGFRYELLLAAVKFVKIFCCLRYIFNSPTYSISISSMLSLSSWVILCLFVMVFSQNQRFQLSEPMLSTSKTYGLCFRNRVSCPVALGFVCGSFSTCETGLWMFLLLQSKQDYAALFSTSETQTASQVILLISFVGNPHIRNLSPSLSFRLWERRAA